MAPEFDSFLTGQSDFESSDSNYPWRAGLPAISVGQVSGRLPKFDFEHLQEVACGYAHSTLDGQITPAYPRSVQGALNS
jgi:hypothetical protein